MKTQLQNTKVLRRICADDTKLFPLTHYFGYIPTIVLNKMSRKEFKLCGLLAVVTAIYFFVVLGCSTEKAGPAAATSSPSTSQTGSTADASTSNAAGTNTSTVTNVPPAKKSSVHNQYAMVIPKLVAGPNDGRIAYVTARLLEEFHYLQEPLDTEMSKKFFDGYIDSLDPRHENFLQSDIDSFDHYRTNLDTYIMVNRNADLTPAYQIFARMLEHFEQHVAYVNELLAEDKFKFTSDDQIEKDRRHAPFPKNMDEAKALWRQRLRFEYLQEKLNRELSTTNEAEILPLTKTNVEEINDTLERHYSWALRHLTNSDASDVLQIYLNALTHAYDPHSDYLNNEHAQDFSIQMSLSLYGIGAQLVEDDGYCTIRELIPGGPAARSKQLNPQDRIMAVAQSNKPPVDVVDMDLGRAVQLIRGPKGSQVRLTISPADDRSARKVVTLVREEIKLEDQEAKAILVEMPDNRGGTNRIGVIDLPSFYATIDVTGNAGHSAKSTTADMTKLIDRLKKEKVAGIIIDLRNNGGGSLEEAVKFVGLFVKEGPVVQARSSDGTVMVDSQTNPAAPLYTGPLIVLANRFSASASEIAAGALQDYGRALIVGDTSTFGKGTVQNLNQLAPFVSLGAKPLTSDPGTVKITIRKFYRISGASTQLKGVIPDIVLPDTLNSAPDIGENALDNPLPYDTIPAVDYKKSNLVRPYLGDLSKLSNTRVGASQDFAYILQDIQEQDKARAEKTTTLNEKDAIKDRQRIAAIRKARDNERADRKPLSQQIYDITVENADKPGLEPHVEPGETNLTATVQSTNSVTSTNSTVTMTNSVAPAPEKKSPPPVDPWLNEAENILEDYIPMVTTNQQTIAHQL